MTNRLRIGVAGLGTVGAGVVRLLQEHPDLLGPLDLTVQQANVSGKTYYRIQAGTFTERSEAERLCARLKAAKQDCLVVRR